MDRLGTLALLGAPTALLFRVGHSIAGHVQTLAPSASLPIPTLYLTRERHLRQTTERGDC